MISPLLDLWSLAIAVDPSAAAPIEGLLSVLVHRTTTTNGELAATMDEVDGAIGALALT